MLRSTARRVSASLSRQHNAARNTLAVVPLQRQYHYGSGNGRGVVPARPDLSMHPSAMLPILRSFGYGRAYTSPLSILARNFSMKPPEPVVAAPPSVQTHSSTSTDPGMPLPPPLVTPPPRRQPPQYSEWSDSSYLRPVDTEIEAIKTRSESALKELEEEYKVYKEAKLTKPAPAQTMANIVPTAQKAAAGIIAKAPKAVFGALKSTYGFTKMVITNPEQRKEKWEGVKATVRETLTHYKVGSKLLWSDIKTANSLVWRMMKGHSLTRRERKQLLRTASDIFRMVPLAIFVIVPFMEFLLPFALKLFPNMLPSRFEHTPEKDDKARNELRMRLALAGFLQETVQEMAQKKKKAVEGGKEKETGDGAAAVALKELQGFMEKAKLGQIGNDDITRFAHLFKDELTLENTSSAQLANLCRFMGLTPFGGDNFLRFQLRTHLRAIRQDDQRILWEGVESLTKAELQEACRERGMRSRGLTLIGYRRQLAQWLDLSCGKQVPISLLIMSRAFTLEAPDPSQALALSIGTMDTDVVKEVMIEAASKEERHTAEYRAMKLESLERQNEKIEEERKKKDKIEKAKNEAKKLEAQLKAETAAKDEAAAKEIAMREASAKESLMTEAKDKDSTSLFADTHDGGDTNAVKAAAQAGASAAPSTQEQKEPVITEAQLMSEGTGTATDRLVKAATSTAPSVEAEIVSQGEVGSKDNQLSEGAMMALRLLTVNSLVKEKAQLASMRAELSESLQEKAAEKAAEAASTQTQKSPEKPSPDSAEIVTVTATTTPPPSTSAPQSSTSTSAIGTSPKTQQKSDAFDAAVAEAQPPHPEAPVTLTSTPSSITLKAPAAPNLGALIKDVIPEASALGAAQKAAAAVEKATSAKAKERAVDKSVEHVQTKLASMLEKLEQDIQKVEAKIGDNFHMLDRDRDGVVGAEELAFVIQNLLSSHSVEEDAKEIVRKLDADSDGQIIVQELIDWVEKYGDNSTELFDDLYMQQHPREEAPPRRTKIEKHSKPSTSTSQAPPPASPPGQI